MKTKTLIIITLLIILITGGVVYGQGGIQQDTDRINQEIYEKFSKEYEIKSKPINITSSNNYNDLDNDNNKITAVEHKILIKITYLEARGESLEGKTAVVRTILNRVESKDFPNSIEEVIYQPGQFQPAKYLGEVEVEEEYLEEIEQSIIAALESEGEELYFVNPEYANQSSYNWMSNNLTFLYREGNHEFYK
ncbi:MAG: cell wall hydrolase [Bacillota bacterium]|nr:cell wall hydrolase [Bacillota bacterium]